MESAKLSTEVRFFAGRDGCRLAYRQIGTGKPLVLIHGFLSRATDQWIHTGHATMLASRGHRIIMPDLRGHGDSAKPHGHSDYSPDVLVDDGIALIEHLGLTRYDLGGYSLGGRIALRMAIRSTQPEQLIAAGRGLDQVVRAGSGSGTSMRHVLARTQTFPPGTPESRLDQWLRGSGADRTTLTLLLDSIVDTPPTELAHIRVPTLVIGGADDDRTTTALAAALPNAQHTTVPGDHATAVRTREFAARIADFLDPPNHTEAQQ